MESSAESGAFSGLHGKWTLRMRIAPTLFLRNPEFNPLHGMHIFILVLLSPESREPRVQSVSRRSYLMKDGFAGCSPFVVVALLDWNEGSSATSVLVPEPRTHSLEETSRLCIEARPPVYECNIQVAIISSSKILCGIQQQHKKDNQVASVNEYSFFRKTNKSWACHRHPWYRNGQAWAMHWTSFMQYQGFPAWWVIPSKAIYGTLSLQSKSNLESLHDLANC